MPITALGKMRSRLKLFNAGHYGSFLSFGHRLNQPQRLIAGWSLLTIFLNSTSSSLYVSSRPIFNNHASKLRLVWTSDKALPCLPHTFYRIWHGIIPQELQRVHVKHMTAISSDPSLSETSSTILSMTSFFTLHNNHHNTRLSWKQGSARSMAARSGQRTSSKQRGIKAKL